MRNKPRKIKRYHKIYRGRGRTRMKILKIAGFVVVIAAVVFVGYSVAGPFLDFINGRIEPTPPSNDSSSIVSLDSSSSLEDSSGGDQVEEQTLQAVNLPVETAKNPSALSSFLSSANAKGANAVVLELKDTAGTLWYRSTVAQAEEYGAVSDGAVEIDQIVETIKEAGLKPIAKLNAFMDKTAPSAARNNGYLYENSNSAWWDNAVNNGGKPWLNPYKKAACDYLIALQNELVSKGFDTIIWHKVEFPEVRTLSSANMGPEAEGVTQQQALNNFIARCETEAAKKDATVFISYPVSAAFGLNESWFGGNPSGLIAKNVAPELDFATFGGNLTIGETAVDFSDTQKAVSQIMGAYRSKVTKAARVLPVLTDASMAEAAAKALDALKIGEYVTP
jgi:hypothetical protein